MSLYNYKTLIRDVLVDDATIKTYFEAALTGSCRVNMENLRASAAYPQILIGYGGGQTTPGMDTDEVNMYLTIECRGSSVGTSLHALKEIGWFRGAILSLLDDTAIGFSGGGGTTAVCYHFRKFSEFEGYKDQENVHWLRIGFDAHYKQTTSYP